MKITRVTPQKYVKLRIFATIIDYGIYASLFFIYLYTVGTPTEDYQYEVTGLLALPIFIFWILYFVVMETFDHATVGHDIFKLTVVKTDGSRVNFYDAFKRRLIDPIDIFIYGIPALICISKTPKHQRLGDLFANTLVVKKTDIIETELLF